MAVLSNLINFSNNGKKAMVTVITGEGANQRSLTRHLVLKGDTWVGNTIDESAKGRHVAALALIANCEKDVEAKAKFLAEFEKKNPEINPKNVKLVRASKSAKTEIVFAEFHLRQAVENLEEVRRQYPLQVEFAF